MTPAVHVTISYGAADPAQMAAWRGLWARLLAGEPENSDAPAAEAEASEREPGGASGPKER